MAWLGFHFKPARDYHFWVPFYHLMPKTRLDVAGIDQAPQAYIAPAWTYREKLSLAACSENRRSKGEPELRLILPRLKLA